MMYANVLSFYFPNYETLKLDAIKHFMTYVEV